MTHFNFAAAVQASCIAILLIGGAGSIFLCIAAIIKTTDNGFDEARSLWLTLGVFLFIVILAATIGAGVQ